MSQHTFMDSGDGTCKWCRRIEAHPGHLPQSVSEPAAFDLVSSSSDDLNRQALEFHKKVHAKLEGELKQSLQRLRSADANNAAEVAKAQAGIDKLEWVLGLPEQVFNEEKEKASGK